MIIHIAALIALINGSNHQLKCCQNVTVGPKSGGGRRCRTELTEHVVSLRCMKITEICLLLSGCTLE